MMLPKMAATPPTAMTIESHGSNSPETMVASPTRTSTYPPMRYAGPCAALKASKRWLLCVVLGRASGR